MTEELRSRRLRAAASALLILAAPAAVIAFATVWIGEEFERHEDDMWDLSCAIVPPALAVWVMVWIANRRKKLGRRFWVTAGISSLLLIYPISFGPACRLCQDGYLGNRPIWNAYRPMWWLANDGPSPIRRQVVRWVEVFLAPTATGWNGLRREVNLDAVSASEADAP